MGSTRSVFVAVSQYKTPAWEVLRHYDAVFRFQPAVATVALADADLPFYKRHFSRLRAMIPRPLAIRMQSAIDRLHQPRLIEYDEVWRKIVEQPIDRALTTLEGAFVDWDNTARYGKRATIYQGAEPERLQRWLERLTDKVRAHNRPEARLIFINAWNEWAESAYLEPDEGYGNRYLLAVRNVAARERCGEPRSVLRAVEES